MKIALCFLSYNEVECLRKLLPTVDSSTFDEVFAVDGGSTDGSQDVYRQHGIKIIAQPSRGRGAAFTIAEEASAADAIVYISTDGNEDPKDLPKFRKYLEGGADLVIASRMIEGAFNEEDISWWRPRKWVNQIFVWTVNFLWGKPGVRITDVSNGYRAMRRGLLKELGINAVGHTIEFQISIRALKKGLKIAEFPTREGQRLAGEIKARSFRTGVQFLECLAKEIWIGKKF